MKELVRETPVVLWFAWKESGNIPVLVGALGEDKSPSLRARVKNYTAWIKANMEK